MFKDDAEIFKFVRTSLHVAAVCDMLDHLGYRHQAMHQRLRPLLADPEACGFVGRAKTLRWMEADYVPEEGPYGRELAAVDSLKSGDVVVHSTSLSGTLTPWGDLMATAAIIRGAVGCVCDANIRDCAKLITMKFPVYYAGIRPLDSQGRGLVVAFDVPIQCGEVLVHPGEMIIADYDGIVVVPKSVEHEVLTLAASKIDKENLTRKELELGKTLGEVYAKYGVL
jgi:regulator of RNase E activity RraA